MLFSAVRKSAPIVLAVLMALLLDLFPARTGNDAGGTGHKQVACGVCHEMMAQLDAEEFSTQNIDRRCRGCHLIIENRIGDGSLGFHDDRKRSCLDCHSYHDLTRLDASGKEFQFQYSSTALLNICGSCHATGRNHSALSEGHREAAKLFHSDYKYLNYLSPSEACLLCHAKGAIVDRNLVQVSTIPVFDQHRGHPLGTAASRRVRTDGYTLRTEFDARLRLIDGRIECQTCHSLISSDNALAADFDTPSKTLPRLSCQGAVGLLDRIV